MFTCGTCGSTEFITDSGFMYCAMCNVQSQEFCEQEEDGDPRLFLSKIKVTQKKESKTMTLRPDDYWTSWDGLNYILRGMTEELISKKLVKDNVRTLILQLWTCFLSKSNVAFTSRTQTKLPKFGVSYKKRDIMVLCGQRGVRRKKRQIRKRVPSQTDLSVTSRVVKAAKKSMINEAYDTYMLSQTSDRLANETLESLGRSHLSDSESSCQSNITDRSLKLWRNKIKTMKNKFSKTTLLAIIHFALLLTEHEIQLSDLLRFIREGHLSFSKVTHFLPEKMRLLENDIFFIESISDLYMPSHLKQRKIEYDLSNYLGLTDFPVPDMEGIIIRYCQDLNLPGRIGSNSIVLYKCLLGPEELTGMSVRGGRKQLFNYEGIAAACIIVVLKFLFGLDGMTEYLLSDLAKKINTIRKPNESTLFVFTHWQKHIECRKALLYEHHYPTQEKLGSNSAYDTNGFAFFDMFVRENKDEFREQRFKMYSQYHTNPKITLAMENTLNELTEPFSWKSANFKPTLTPQSDYLNSLLKLHGRGVKTDKTGAKIDDGALNILRMNFTKCDANFMLDLDSYVDVLKQNGFTIVRKLKEEYNNVTFIKSNHDHFFDETDEEDAETYNKIRRELNETMSNPKKVVFVKDITNYWVLKSKNYNRNDYGMHVFNKAPNNLRWLLYEFSMMLEMNTKEIFEEVKFVETKLTKQFWRKTTR